MSIENSVVLARCDLAGKNKKKLPFQVILGFVLVVIIFLDDRTISIIDDRFTWTRLYFFTIIKSRDYFS